MEPQEGLLESAARTRPRAGGDQGLQPASPAAPRLLDRVRDEIRVRHYSIRTDIRNILELLGHVDVFTTSSWSLSR